MFVSFSQNFEDVMLWRALNHIENGFYVDVGAAWPEQHSVTKSFYDHGWSGINIEPNISLHEALVSARPRDVNLCVAIGDIGGSQVMSFIHDTGLSTLEPTIATSHALSNWELDNKEVEVFTLANICNKFIKGNQEIHFLKIDVEGFEAQVLRGNTWSLYRPWIVVVESTKPLSTEQVYENWESELTSNGYIFAYADGLNRFYVAGEHAELLSSFSYPPNVFDNFVNCEQLQAEAKAQEAEAKAQEAEAKAQEAEAKAQEAEAEAKDLEQKVESLIRTLGSVESKCLDELNNLRKHLTNDIARLELRANSAEIKINEIYSSSSWKITKPLRLVATSFIRAMSHVIASMRFLKISLVRMLNWNYAINLALSSQFLKRLYMALLKFLPQSIQNHINLSLLKVKFKLNNSNICISKNQTIMSINRTKFNSKYIDRLNKNFEMLTKK